MKDFSRYLETIKVSFVGDEQSKQRLLSFHPDQACHLHRRKTAILTLSSPILWFHIRALHQCFLDERFSKRVRCKPLAGHSPNLLTARLTSWLTDRLSPWIPMYIYFHNVYAFFMSFQLSIHVIYLHPRIACFLIILLFTQWEHPDPEIIDLRLCQRSLCNTIILVLFFFFFAQLNSFIFWRGTSRSFPI